MGARMRSRQKMPFKGAGHPGAERRAARQHRLDRRHSNRQNNVRHVSSIAKLESLFDRFGKGPIYEYVTYFNGAPGTKTCSWLLPGKVCGSDLAPASLAPAGLRRG
jgi:hypothetical protein